MSTDLLTEIVAAPLDLPHPPWPTCPLGYPPAESDLNLRTGELAASRCCCGKADGPTAGS